MKTCGKCKQKKYLSEFADNKEKNDGKQYQCRQCQKKYRSDHYKKNKKKIIGQIKKRKIFIRDYVWSIKCKSSCADCGESDPVVLEFDHLGVKNFSIALAATNGYSIEKINSEIEKCEIICANCHRRRTFSRGGWEREELVE